MQVALMLNIIDDIEEKGIVYYLLLDEIGKYEYNKRKYMFNQIKEEFDFNKETIKIV